MRVVFLFLLFITSFEASAGCSRAYRFVLSGLAPIVSGGYSLFSGDGCLSDGQYSLGDLFTPELFLRDDFASIVHETFHRLENQESWSMDSILVQSFKKQAPDEYEKMKAYFVDNTSKLAGLNPQEKELIKENPAGALWVMYNGSLANQMQERYSSTIDPGFREIKGDEFPPPPEPENAGYLGKGDAFRHIAWNLLASRFGFEDFAKRFIDAHENGREEQGPTKRNSLLENQEQASLFQRLFNAQMEAQKNDPHSEHNSKADSEMDHRNNEVGRKLAEKNYCTINSEVLYGEIVNTIESGNAFIVDNCPGRKHLVIKSNMKYKACDSQKMPSPDDIERACDEFFSKITVETPFAKLAEMVHLEGADPNAVGCAYYRHFETAFMDKLGEDEFIAKLFEVRDKLRSDFAKTTPLNEGNERFQMRPGPYPLSDEEMNTLCTKMKNAFKMIANDLMCREAIFQMGFSENSNLGFGEGFDDNFEEDFDEDRAITI